MSRGSGAAATERFRLRLVRRRVCMEQLPDDVLARILHEACRPVPWPWCETVGLVSRRWLRVCTARRVRGWYLAHSTIQ